MKWLCLLLELGLLEPAGNWGGRGVCPLGVGLVAKDKPAVVKPKEWWGRGIMGVGRCT